MISKIPLARSTDIVVQELKTEILVYDLKTHKAYSLNETTSMVYQACDGRTSFDVLKRKHRKLTDEVIILALGELERMNLLAEKVENEVERRELLKKAAMSALTLPLIVGITAPTSAQSNSCLPNDAICKLSAPDECCGRNCVPSVGLAPPTCQGACLNNGQSCDPNSPQNCCSGYCGFEFFPGPYTCMPRPACIENDRPCNIDIPEGCCGGYCVPIGDGKAVCSERPCIPFGEVCDMNDPNNCCTGTCQPTGIMNIPMCV